MTPVAQDPLTLTQWAKWGQTSLKPRTGLLRAEALRRSTLSGSLAYPACPSMTPSTMHLLLPRMMVRLPLILPSIPQ